MLIRFMIPAHGNLIAGRAHDALPRAVRDVFLRLILKIEQRKQGVQIRLLLSAQAERPESKSTEENVAT